METTKYQNQLMQHTCGLSNGEKRNFFGTGSGLVSYAKGRNQEDWTQAERDARDKRDKLEDAKEKINCKYGDVGDLWL